MSKKRGAPDEGDRHHVPNPKKKQRTYTAVDAQLAKLYEDLASELNEVRIEAATSLISHVKAQIASDKAASPLESERKIFVRLTRGLCSSRKAARMGFSIALSELFRIALQDPTDEKIKDVVGLIEKNTAAEGGASGQEKRDHALGRLTAFGALLRSGVLQRSEGTASSARAVADRIFAIYTDSPWLAEECGIILGEAVQTQGEDNADFSRAIVESIVASGKARSPEGVAIWLDALQNEVKKLPKDIWRHRDPLNKKELTSVCKIINHNQVESADGESISGQSGTRRHAPHYAWESVLRHVCARKDEKLFEQYWTETFDNHFFGKSASPEKKALGFQNFAKAVSWLPREHFDVAFSQNLMKTLINQSSQSQRYLHAAARSTLTAIASRAENGDEEDVVAVCTQLLSQNGNISFDKLTHTKTVHDFLAATESEHLVGVAAFIFSKILEPTASDDAKTSSALVQSTADFLLSLVRSRDLLTEEIDFEVSSWILEMLLGLGEYVYVNEKPSEANRTVIKSRLFSILSHLISSGMDLGLELPAYLMQNLLCQASTFVPVRDTDEGVKETLERAKATFDKLAHDPTLYSSSDVPECRVLRLLFSMTMLQAYAAETDAIELLPDLEQCYNDVLGSDGKKARGIEAIMDIIMDFASRQSALHRKLAEQVFAAFAPELERESLDQMLEVLGQKENVAGQQALFDGQEGAEADSEHGEDATDTSTATSADSEHDAEDDDVEVVEADSDVEVDNPAATDEEDEVDSDDIEGGDDDNDGELAKFDALLASALKTDPNQDASDSDADMDDDQMMALEPHLAAIFRERAAAASKDGKTTQKKAEHKSAKENITAFKNRVLDLLQIYVRQCPDNSLATTLILPLLRLIRITGSKQVANKAYSLLKNYFDLAKKKGWASPLKAFDHYSKKPIQEHLRAIHEEALRFGSKMHAQACSSASLVLSRALLLLPSESQASTSGQGFASASQVNTADSPKQSPNSEAMQFLVDLYAKTHLKRLQSTKKEGLPASFWEEWLRWSLQAGATTQPVDPSSKKEEVVPLIGVSERRAEREARMPSLVEYGDGT